MIPPMKQKWKKVFKTMKLSIWYFWVNIFNHIIFHFVQINIAVGVVDNINYPKKYYCFTKIKHIQKNASKLTRRIYLSPAAVMIKFFLWKNNVKWSNRLNKRWSNNWIFLFFLNSTFVESNYFANFTAWSLNFKWYCCYVRELHFSKMWF